MKEEFVTFKKFNENVAAVEFGILLSENNIEYLLENHSIPFDPTYSNNELTKEFRIKIKKEDFKKVDELLMQIPQTDLNEVEPDYYLFEFTDNELIDVVSKKDEWGSFDYLLAQKILKERGKEIKPEVIEKLKKQRLKELKEPETNQKKYIMLGYLGAFLGGIIGFFIGWHLLTHKKTLPNGERVYTFNTKDRKQGIRILILSGIVLLALFSYKVVSQLI